MSYLDSPIGICAVEHAIVLTDQTQKQCASNMLHAGL
jgi:hypothetical protein